MNTTRNALAAVVLLGTSASPMAASTVELIVKGVITPNACEPSLSGNGVVDYGKISAKDLNLTTYTELPKTTLQLQITCDGKTLYAVKGTDNRVGSSPYTFIYGLGLINGNQKLGGYGLRLNSATADSVATTPLQSQDNGTTWMSLYEDSDIGPTDLAAFGDRSTGVWLPIPIQQLITNLEVNAFIVRADSLDLSDEHPIDGSATFEVKYL
ncbi:DUF1120 domain-containing protein [uncultured Pseudomonas sp.]|uniref:DUF1120 domain-containing protein n=1 Tax=uncultured Pseudomonas sp. TaxID=114707 RepID=UPI0025DF6491|nr:DUF1120 domain-containing protein [uncultured Pseudomonas sp.]